MDPQERDAPRREAEPPTNEKVANCIAIASLVVGITSTVLAILPFRPMSNIGLLRPIAIG